MAGLVKPANAARRADYVFIRVPHATAARFIREHHYARGCAKTSVLAVGMLHRERGLVGAALWMPPTRVCGESVSGDWKKVLSLSLDSLLLSLNRRTRLRC
jgi:hypothetical protein